MAVEEAPTRRPEAAPVPERLGFQEGLIGLQTRLLLEGNALNPRENIPQVEQQVIFSFDVRASERDGTYALINNASRRERQEYWQQKEVQGFDAQKQAWVESTAAKFQNHQQYFEHTEKGRSWKSAFARIGVDTQTFGSAQAEELYNTLFTREAQENAAQRFVATVLSGYLSPENGTVDHEALHQDLDAWQWFSRMYGDKSSQINTQLLDAEAKLLTPDQRQRLIEQTNSQDTTNDNQQVSRVNNLRPKEVELLNFLQSSRQITPQPSDRTGDDHTPAPSQRTEQDIQQMVEAQRQLVDKQQQQRAIEMLPQVFGQAPERYKFLLMHPDKIMVMAGLKPATDINMPSNTYDKQAIVQLENALAPLGIKMQEMQPYQDQYGNTNHYIHLYNPSALAKYAAANSDICPPYDPQQPLEVWLREALGRQELVLEERTPGDKATFGIINGFPRSAIEDATNNRLHGAPNEKVFEAYNETYVIANEPKTDVLFREEAKRQFFERVEQSTQYQLLLSNPQVQQSENVWDGLLPDEYRITPPTDSTPPGVPSTGPQGSEPTPVPPTEEEQRARGRIRTGEVRYIPYEPPKDVPEYPVTSEELAETERWVMMTPQGFRRLHTFRRNNDQASENRYLTHTERRVRQEREHIETNFKDPLPPLDPIGNWERQTNAGMLTCQLASAGNALRFLGKYDPGRHSEQKLIEAMGGQRFLNEHRAGMDTRDLFPVLERLNPELEFISTASVYDILDNVKNGAAAIIPVSNDHVATIPPGSRLQKNQGRLEVQVTDPLHGIRFVPVESLLKSEITTMVGTADNSTLIIKVKGQNTVNELTPQDIAEVENWIGPIESRDKHHVARVARKLKDERTTINEHYGGHLPYLTPIADGSWEKQTNPGMFTCQFTAAGNILRTFGVFDPAKHTEKAFIDTLGGQEYVNTHREGATFFDVEQAIRRFSPEMYPKLTNSVYEILESVEKGEGAIIPVSAGHVAAILPGNRVSRDTNGNLQVQVVDSISGIYNVPIENLLKSDLILPIDNRSPYNRALILRKENPVRMTRRT